MIRLCQTLHKGYGQRGNGLFRWFGGSSDSNSLSNHKQKVKSGVMIRNSLSEDGPLEEIEYSKQYGLSWYCCGPTVYSHSHLGHGRCYVTFDAIRNTLNNWFKVPTNYWMNITDIDDKIIAKAKELDQDHKEVSGYWEQDFFQKMDKLLVKRPDKVLRVSQHIPEIITYISQIVKNGFAYQVGSSVYFDVQKFRNQGHQYCKLVSSAYQDSGLEPAQAPSGEKKHHADFALWKAAKDGEPSWYSPWGQGRPGWHIECSAMIQSCLKPGQSLDLHTGGSDLRFPHHANEIAQGEAHDCSHHWVSYFMHVAALTISGLKMSKSLKNFITIDQALEQASGQDLRLLFLSHHYSKPMNFNPEGSIKEAQSKLRSIQSAYDKLQRKITTFDPSHQEFGSSEGEVMAFIEAQTNSIGSLLSADMNFPEVIGTLLDICKRIEQLVSQTRLTLTELYHLKTLLLRVTDGVLGLQIEDGSEFPVLSRVETTRLFKEFIKFRSGVVEATKSKSIPQLFTLSDQVRDQVLPSFGILIHDEKSNSSRGNMNDSQPTASFEARNKSKANKSDDYGSVFLSPRYAKFRIGKIGADGLPESDLSGKPFPPKVMERFKRDLHNSLKSSNHDT